MRKTRRSLTARRRAVTQILSVKRSITGRTAACHWPCNQAASRLFAFYNAVAAITRWMSSWCKRERSNPRSSCLTRLIKDITKSTMYHHFSIVSMNLMSVFHYSSTTYTIYLRIMFTIVLVLRIEELNFQFLVQTQYGGFEATICSPGPW